MTQATTFQTLIPGAPPGNMHLKNFRSAKHWIPQELQTSFKIKTSLFPPTITHSSWSTCFRSHLCPNTSSLHTLPNSALTQPTSSLNSDPPFEKSNFICPSCAFSNLNPTHTLLLLCTSWPLILCSTHSSLMLQTGIPNHVVWATNSGCTNPCACIFAARALDVPNHMPTLDQSIVTSFHKRTPWYLIWLNHATL